MMLLSSPLSLLVVSRDSSFGMTHERRQDIHSIHGFHKNIPAFRSSQMGHKVGGHFELNQAGRTS